MTFWSGVLLMKSETFCGIREFSFYNYVNLQINMVICKFMKGFYFVISHQTVIFLLFGNSTFNITQHLKSFSFYQTVFLKHLYYLKCISLFVHLFIHY